MTEHAFHILTEDGDRLRIEEVYGNLAAESGDRLVTEVGDVLFAEQDLIGPNDGHIILESFGEAPPAIGGVFRPLYRPRRR